MCRKLLVPLSNPYVILEKNDDNTRPSQWKEELVGKCLGSIREDRESKDNWALALLIFLHQVLDGRTKGSCSTSSCRWLSVCDVGHTDRKTQCGFFPVPFTHQSSFLVGSCTGNILRTWCPGTLRNYLSYCPGKQLWKIQLYLLHSPADIFLGLRFNSCPKVCHNSGLPKVAS